MIWNRAAFELLFAFPVGDTFENRISDPVMKKSLDGWWLSAVLEQWNVLCLDWTTDNDVFVVPRFKVKISEGDPSGIGHIVFEVGTNVLIDSGRQIIGEAGIERYDGIFAEKQ